MGRLGRYREVHDPGEQRTAKYLDPKEATQRLYPLAREVPFSSEGAAGWGARMVVCVCLTGDQTQLARCSRVRVK